MIGAAKWRSLTLLDHKLALQWFQFDLKLISSCLFQNEAWFALQWFQFHMKLISMFIAEENQIYFAMVSIENDQTSLIKVSFEKKPLHSNQISLIFH